MKLVWYLGHFISHAAIYADPFLTCLIQRQVAAAVSQNTRLVSQCDVDKYTLAAAPLKHMQQKKRQFCWTAASILALNTLTNLSSTPTIPGF